MTVYSHLRGAMARCYPPVPGRRFHFAIMTYLLVIAGIADGSEAVLPGDPILERFTLENGLRVWHLQRRQTDSVVVGLSMDVGAEYETEENNGISHFLEHMLYAETEKYPKGKVTEVITKRGGVYNGFTDVERTFYFAAVAAEEFPTASEWIAQIVFHPTLPADRVDQERNVVFQEKGGRMNWFARMLINRGFGYDVDTELRKALFPETGLALPVIGSEKTLNRINHADLAAYYKDHYAPNNAVLIVVGNVSHDAVRKACDAYFAPIPSAPVVTAPPLPSPPAQLEREAIKVRAPTAHGQCTLVTGARTAPFGHADWWTNEVLATYLNLAVESESRYKNGLTYGIWVVNTGYSDTGLLFLRTQCARKDVKTVRSMVAAEIEAMRNGDINSERLDEAKSQMRGEWALALESNLRNAAWLGQLASCYGDDEPLPNYNENVSAVTAENLTATANAYFTPERMATVIHMPLF